MGKIADMVAKMMADGRRSADIVGAVAKAEDAGLLPEGAIFGVWEAFWRRYPHKTGKPDAERAFKRAMNRPGVTGAAILEGLERYIYDKPPERPWLNPSTFINQERWNDRPAPIQAPKPRGFDHFAAAIEAENGNRPDRSPENDPHHAGGVPLLGFGHH